MLVSKYKSSLKIFFLASSLIFVDNAKSLKPEWRCFTCAGTDLPANIRIAKAKNFLVTNALAYFATESVTEKIVFDNFPTGRPTT